MNVEIRELNIGYRLNKHEKVIARNLSATIKQGELTCLIGTNGVGKSTLLRTLSGFQPKLSGGIRIGEKEIENYSNKELSRIIGVVLTEKVDARDMTVRELVSLGRSPYTGFWGKPTTADKEIVDEAIGLVQLEPLAERTVETLSDGERQKAMIAKSLAQQTPVIYLDEPTAFLDYPSKVDIIRLLKQLAKQEHKTVFFSTHDLELALQLSDKLWLMSKEKGLQVGSIDELMENGSLGSLFQNKFITFDTETQLFRITNNA